MPGSRCRSMAPLWMLECSQRGALVLDRLRNGGRQAVTVQHITVADGGQAVVTGTLKQGRGGSKVSDPLPPHAKPRPGARTPEGLERCRKATWKHGRRSAEAIAGQRLRGQARRIVADLCALIHEAKAACAAQDVGSSLRDADVESGPLT